MALIVLVLDFSLSKGSITVSTPVNGLQALIHKAFFSHFAEYFNLLSLKFRLDCKIGVVEIAPYAKALELSLLTVKAGKSKLTAALTKLNRVDCAVLANLL